MHFILSFTAYILFTWKTVQNVACIVLDTDKNINLPVQILFPLGNISISTVPVKNAKQFIEEDNYLVKRNNWKRRSHTRLQTRWWSADACQRPPKLRLCPSKGTIRVARTTEYCSFVAILQTSADGTNLYCIRIRVANTNGYCQKTNDSCHDTTQ